MEANYLDFRYLQFRETPSSSKCAFVCMLAGIALSLPYFCQIIFRTCPYIQIHPSFHSSGLIRCLINFVNPYGLELTRYIEQGFGLIVPDLIIFLVTIILWTLCMSFLMNDSKKRWQLFPSTITFGFTLPLVIFTLSIFVVSNALTIIAKIINNPITSYLLLSFALGIIFGKKKILYIMIPGALGYFLGYLIVVYVTHQITNSQFERIIPTTRIITLLSLAQIAKNLVWNFFIGIGVFATYSDARRLSDSVARFEDTKTNNQA